MSFLDQVWKTLQARKTKQLVNPSIAFPKEMKGYRTIPIQSLQRIQPKINLSRVDGREIMSNYGQKKIIYFQQNAPLVGISSNGFFSCFYQAYMAHGDVKIKPDEVWMIIMMWFVKYVNDNAEQLRKAFVSHEGKMKLSVMIACNGDHIDWNSFFSQMIQRVRQNTIGKTVQKLECNFSCTSQFDRVFSTAAIMCGFKKYFDYQAMGAGCGIVKMHMGGTLEDWEHLVRKLDGLLEYDVDGRLKSYVNGLRPVLEQFVQTYKGYAHLQFWNNIYHERKDPNIPSYTVSKVINGWLIKFFTCEDSIIDRPQVQAMSVDIAFKNLTTMQEKKLTLLGATQGYFIENLHIYQPQFAIGIAEKKQLLTKPVFKSKRYRELSPQYKKKREQGFILPNAAQIVELRAKSKSGTQKMPVLQTRNLGLKQIYSAVVNKLKPLPMKNM